MKYRDITMPVRDGMVHWPSDPPVSIKVVKSPDKGNRSTISFWQMGSHTGTHMDAPRHYIPGGTGIDAVPLDYLIGPCQVIDCRGMKAVTQRAVEGLDVASAPRVLFRTDNSERMAREGFIEDFAYLEEGAARWLLEQGAVLIGVDGLSIDGYHAPKPAAHMAVLGAGKVIVEGLNLAGVPAGCYRLICLPLRVEGGDGSPVRAILER